jgi:phenylalanyl-tRNA synthetase beta chain
VVKVIGGKMPVITVNRKDFCELVGKEMPMHSIEEKLPMLGVAWEGVEADNFTIEVFPNRPDMLSVEGLARAFSAFIGEKTGLKNYKAEQSEYLVKVDEKTKNVRPFIVSAVIKNVVLTDDAITSLMQLQEKLHITHCRKRRKVAIGVHDLDKVHFPVLYTTKPKDFKFIPLGEEREMNLEEILTQTPKGKDYAWILEGKKEYPILIDSLGTVLSMPPIINSENTKVDEKTKNLFLDITGTCEKAMNEVLNIIVTSLADRGASIYKVKVKYTDRVVQTPDLSPRNISLNPNYVNKLLGLKLTNEEIIQNLKRMGYDATELGKDKLEVVIPCYRTDIMHPIDLVEDVAIAFGYEKFQPEIPNIATIGEENSLEIFLRKLRNFLVGYGLQEVTTFMLTNKNKLFSKMNMPEVEIAETLNPKTEEYCVLRNWLLPSLMEVLWRNRHHTYPQNIFEISDVIHLDNAADTGTKTVRRLAIVLCHSKANFSEIKSMAESILQNLGIKDYKIEEGKCPCFIEGRDAKIEVSKRIIGRFGEIHPLVLENWKLEMPVAALEMDVDMLFVLSK